MGRRRSFISFTRPRTSFKIRRSTRASSNTTFILIFHILSYGGAGRLLFLHRIRGHRLSSADDFTNQIGFKMISEKAMMLLEAEDLIRTR